MYDNDDEKKRNKKGRRVKLKIIITDKEVEDAKS